MGAGVTKHLQSESARQYGVIYDSLIEYTHHIHGDDAILENYLPTDYEDFTNTLEMVARDSRERLGRKSVENILSLMSDEDLQRLWAYLDSNRMPLTVEPPNHLDNRSHTMAVEEFIGGDDDDTDDGARPLPNVSQNAPNGIICNGHVLDDNTSVISYGDSGSGSDSESDSDGPGQVGAVVNCELPDGSISPRENRNAAVFPVDMIPTIADSKENTHSEALSLTGALTKLWEEEDLGSPLTASVDGGFGFSPRMEMRSSRNGLGSARGMLMTSSPESKNSMMKSYMDRGSEIDARTDRLSALQRQKVLALTQNAELEREVEQLQRIIHNLDASDISPGRSNLPSLTQNRQLGNGSQYNNSLFGSHKPTTTSHGTTTPMRHSEVCDSPRLFPSPVQYKTSRPLQASGMAVTEYNLGPRRETVSGTTEKLPKPTDKLISSSLITIAPSSSSTTSAQRTGNSVLTGGNSNTGVKETQRSGLANRLARIQHSTTSRTTTNRSSFLSSSETDDDTIHHRPTPSTLTSSSYILGPSVASRINNHGNATDSEAETRGGDSDAESRLGKAGGGDSDTESRYRRGGRRVPRYRFKPVPSVHPAVDSDDASSAPLPQIRGAKLGTGLSSDSEQSRPSSLRLARPPLSPIANEEVSSSISNVASPVNSRKHDYDDQRVDSDLASGDEGFPRSRRPIRRNILSGVNKRRHSLDGFVALDEAVEEQLYAVVKEVVSGKSCPAHRLRRHPSHTHDIGDSIDQNPTPLPPSSSHPSSHISFSAAQNLKSKPGRRGILSDVSHENPPPRVARANRRRMGGPSSKMVITARTELDAASSHLDDDVGESHTATVLTNITDTQSATDTTISPDLDPKAIPEWTEELSQRWMEVSLLMRRRLTCAADLTDAANAAAAGLKFIATLHETAQNLGVLRGTLSRWVLPFDANTSIAEQRSTPHSVVENMPVEWQGRLTERQVHGLVSGANGVRCLVRIKIADDNDLEQAREALSSLDAFFRDLKTQATLVGTTPYELLRKQETL